MVDIFEVFMKTIPVTCALIIHQGKVLAAKRSASMDLAGKWEFPGGKLELGEEPRSCLIREIHEELGISISTMEELSPVEFAYTSKTILLIPFTAAWIAGEIELLEHENVGWFGREELISLDWAEADLPILHELIEKWVKLVESTES